MKHYVNGLEARPIIGFSGIEFDTTKMETERVKQMVNERVNYQYEKFLRSLDQRIEGFVLESDYRFEFIFHEFNAKFVGARPMQSFLYAQNKMKRDENT